MRDKSLPTGTALRTGWSSFKEHWPFMVAMMLTYVALDVVSTFVFTAIAGDNTLVLNLLNIIYIVVVMVFTIGVVKEGLLILAGKKPTYANLFKHWNLFINYFIVNILYLALSLGGLLLLIFPGVIWALKFSLAPILVIDKKMKPIEALKESARLTMGAKWDLLGFYGVLVFVEVLGILLLLVGAIVTIPVAWIALLYGYRHLQQES